MRAISWFWAKKLVSFTAPSPQRKKHLLGMFFVIALSVVPLILVIILSNGMTEGITSKYVSLQSGSLQIAPERWQASSGEQLAIINEIVQNLPGTAFAGSAADGFGIIYAGVDAYSGRIRGVDDGFLLSEPVSRELDVVAGTLHLKQDRNIIIGQALAEQLGLSIGDKTALAAVNYNTERSFFKPLVFEVSGIVASGYQALDRELVLIRYQAAVQLFGTSARGYSFVLLENSSLRTARSVAERIMNLPEARGMIVSTWDSLNAALFRNFAETKNILYVLMGLIILIAGVNVSSTCSMLIHEQYRAIGVVKAIGAGSRDIRNSFLAALMTITFAGALFGTVVGLVIGVNLNAILAVISRTGLAAADFYLIRIPLRVRFVELALVMAFTLTVAYVSVLIPLFRLRKIVPVRIINN